MTPNVLPFRDRSALRRPLAPATVTPGSRAAQADPRWPAVAAALGALRDQHRRAVRIVDADCGAGTLLLGAARHARSLGFTSIEARGIDGSPAMIGRAHAAAARLSDPAIGAEFELADMVDALAAEAELPADLVLWHGTRSDDRGERALTALAAAGDVVIGDPGAPATRPMA